MNYIIIVAGGKGLRMGGNIPKQFLPVGGKPILMRTIKRFYEYDRLIRIILVLPKIQHDYWLSLCKKYDFNIPYLIADGGDTRFHSVSNGLALIPNNEEGIVGVHDGVRPFVSTEVIRRCYDKAKEYKAVIPVINVVETIRHIAQQEKSNSMRSITVPRCDYRLVQTPQTFDIKTLKQAYKQPYKNTFTDDASVVESMGYNITLVEGNRENIKITTPFDLTIAEALLKG